ncbi:hypothetical protein PQQ53_14130 [Paraburkholderia strydomiana]|jgi:hypothetical protein|uniref:hypothetical protein n=1 Tax=Paraburkholderia strydomiana TaxID=1245417 RepID=UPI0038BC90D5
MATIQERAIRSRRAAHWQRNIGSIRIHSWSVRTSLVEATLLGSPLADHARELRIRALGELMCAAQTRVMRARCWYLMRQEINARSGAQVRLLEGALGLTA